MTLFGDHDICNLSQVMAYKMSQEFPTASLDATVYEFVSSS